MRHIRVIVVAALVVALAAVAAASALAATKSVGVKKSGTKYSFTPATLRISKGDSVRWSWSGSVPHNVSGPGFKSGTAPRLTFTRRFTRAGTFTVVCTLHRALGQRMKVVVS